jgi:5'-methylthioadenosine phosphorylase
VSAPTSSPRLGIIGGSAFLDAEPIAGAERLEVATPRGAVSLHVGAGFVFLRRHGEGVYRPPHRVPHHAHVLALKALGVRQVAGFASSGSLHRELQPGDLVVPDDYLSWHDPPTFAEDEYLHVVPALDADVRGLLLCAADAAMEAAARPGAGSGTGSGGVGRSGAPPVAHGAGARLRGPVLERGGVYVETRGPRFETAAEVRLLAAHARVVGMTAASEATLCQERGIGYAMICTVDNWANGIGAPPLTLELFRAQAARSGVLARRVLERLLDLWRGAAEPLP